MRLSFLVLALIVAGCSRSDNKPIDLGHLEPNNHGEAEFKALDLAVEELNKDPARLPTGRRVRVVHAPAGAKPEEAGAQATRLVALNKVHGLIGGERFDQAERIGAAVQGEGVVAVSPADWGGPPSPDLFTVGVAPAERGRVLAKAVLERKPHSVAIVRDPAARSANLAADQFAAECHAAGVRVTDPYAESARASVDAIFFALPVGLALQARVGGDKLCLFGGGDADFPSLLAGGPPAEGFLVATAFHPDAKSDLLTAFTGRYREKYGQPPPVAAVLAHDALTVWVEAARRANSLEVEPLREQMRKRDQPFESLTGPLIFADDHTARRPIFVGRVADGILKDVRPYDPAPIN
jgi:ABC-type branched-subunit amino acid transport system substrate-binding protein